MFGTWLLLQHVYVKMYSYIFQIVPKAAIQIPPTNSFSWLFNPCNNEKLPLKRGYEPEFF